MRLAAMAIASLLFACSPADENAASDPSAVGNMSAPAPTGPTGTGGPPEEAPSGQQAPINGGAQPSGEITLSASPEQVSSGATVTLALSNGTSGRIGYNLCTSALQTASGGEVRTDRVCTLELRTLDPGATTTYGYELPTGLDAGSYRFSRGLERMPSGGRTTVTSNSIQVR